MLQSTIHIDLDRLAGNIRKLKMQCAPGVSFMAVVKANGYGHGAVAVSETALENGADFLAVARIQEAMELRYAGIKAPILLFGSVSPAQAEWLALNDVRITIGSVEAAEAVSTAASIAGHTVKVHLKIDTGMGRIGFVAPRMYGAEKAYASHGDDYSADIEDRYFADVVRSIASVSRLEGISIEGIYTHFANADSCDKSHVTGQISSFRRIIEALEEEGIRPSIIHAANSAAVMELPESHFNMVRAGIAMYGLMPSDEVRRDLITIEPVMSVKSHIVHLKSVPDGFRVSYGSTFMTGSSTTIATVPVGYADGYSRLLSSKGFMLVKGVRCPVVGRVCMDYTMIDVGRVPGVSIGEEVVIMGSQGEDEITADEIARIQGTINYEVVCSFDRRMPVVLHKRGCE